MLRDHRCSNVKKVNKCSDVEERSTEPIFTLGSLNRESTRIARWMNFRPASRTPIEDVGSNASSTTRAFAIVSLSHVGREFRSAQLGT